jgi:hypothetical protein
LKSPDVYSSLARITDVGDEPIMNGGRLEAFSDGVIAAVAALLWLVPDRRIASVLRGQ